MSARLRIAFMVFGVTLLLSLFNSGLEPVWGQKEATPETVKTTGDMGLGGELGKIIAATPVGEKTGRIDPNAPPGFLGIPGALAPALWAGLLWAIWVGWIFSTVGAFGGVMAGVGHITSSTRRPTRFSARYFSPISPIPPACYGRPPLC